MIMINIESKVRYYTPIFWHFYLVTYKTYKTRIIWNKELTKYIKAGGD